jgi:SsrA-binding protein
MGVRVENKKARFDYEVIEQVEAGVVLTGAEVKSVKAGAVNMVGARVLTREDGIWLVGVHINKYPHDSNPDYVPDRTRKLLIHKKEIAELAMKRTSEGLTLIPLRMYNKGSFVKVAVGLVRGKKQYEKRELLKRKTVQKELSRRLKVRN